MNTQQTFDCEINSCKKINDDVYLISLQVPEGLSFTFKAGQYLFIQMSEDDARPYSIASAPSTIPEIQLHIRDIPGNDFTGQVLERLINETHINIRRPDGSCTLDCSNSNRPLLFIAGGTGFSPCHSMIHSLIESADPRNISLYWGANNSSEFYLKNKAEQWETEQSNFSFIPVVANPNDGWTGEIGFVHEAVFRNVNHLSDYDVYISGSEQMVLNIYQKLRDKNIPSSQIHSDMLDILRAKGQLTKG